MQYVRLISKAGEVVKEYHEQLDLSPQIDESGEEVPIPILNLDGRHFTYADSYGDPQHGEVMIFKETDCHPVSGAFVVT